METVDLMSPQFVENPYAAFRDLRNNSPVCKVSPIGYWGLSRHEDVANGIANTSLFSSKAMTDANAVFPEIRRYLEAEALVAMDPPRHGVMRRVVNKAFSSQNINALEDRIRGICRTLLDQVPDPSRFDLIASLALPLPVTVICELLGVAHESRKDFKRWSDGILLTLPVTSMPEGPEKEQAKKVVEASYRELEEFLIALMDERRKRPAQDLISAMVSASEEERITVQDVVSLSRLLLIAGSETTTNLIALGMRILVSNKEILPALRQDRSLIPAFTEETLRYDGPTMAVLRLLTDDVQLHGVTMKKGERVALFLSSANRDERQYANADEFDMTRTTGHMAFGKGNHFCIGAHLARMEFRVALEAMLDRFSGFSLGENGFAHSTAPAPRTNELQILSTRRVAAGRDRAYLDRYFKEDLEKGVIKSPLELNQVWPENYSANSAQKVWGANFAAHHPNVAVLDLSSFKCGHDAPTYGLIDAIVQTSKTPTAALHDIDANKPGGSIKIRVKTYAHSLLLQQERLEDVSRKKRALAESLDKKRLELFELKRAQLDSLSKKDPELERQIDELGARLRSYEASRDRPIEPPAGIMQLGRRREDGSIERIGMKPHAHAPHPAPLSATPQADTAAE